MIYFLDMIS